MKILLVTQIVENVFVHVYKSNICSLKTNLFAASSSSSLEFCTDGSANPSVKYA